MEIVRVLLEEGCAVDAHDRVAKHLFTYAQHLLSRQSGWTSLHCSCMRGDLEVASLLIEHGADVDSASRVILRRFPCVSHHDHRIAGLPFTAHQRRGTTGLWRSCSAKARGLT